MLLNLHFGQAITGIEKALVPVFCAGDPGNEYLKRAPEIIIAPRRTTEGREDNRLPAAGGIISVIMQYLMQAAWLVSGVAVQAGGIGFR